MEVDERRHLPGRKPADSGEGQKAYEKLRDEGNSKSKSARFANAAAGSSVKSVGRKGGKAGTTT